jgi:hypothetical protein
MTEHFEVQRSIAAPFADIVAVLADPQGHVAIDASGMLQDTTGDPAKQVGDQFVIHMDREHVYGYRLESTADEALVTPFYDVNHRLTNAP